MVHAFYKVHCIYVSSLASCNHSHRYIVASMTMTCAEEPRIYAIMYGEQNNTYNLHSAISSKSLVLLYIIWIKYKPIYLHSMHYVYTPTRMAVGQILVLHLTSNRNIRKFCSPTYMYIIRYTGIVHYYMSHVCYVSIPSCLQGWQHTSIYGLYSHLSLHNQA